MREIKPIHFEDDEIRVFEDDNGDNWFVGRDICNAIGYSNSRITLKQHCEEKPTYLSIKSSNGTFDTRVVSVIDMHRLLISSKRPKAKRLEQWMLKEGLVNYSSLNV